MGYDNFRFARRIDADTIGLYNESLTGILSLKEASSYTYLKPLQTNMRIQCKTDYPMIDFLDGEDISIRMHTGKDLAIYNQTTEVASFDGAGCLFLKETTTPTARTDYGAVYTKNDNKLYFQDGAGTEHEVAFV